MSQPVKMKVDLANGLIEIEADASNVEAILERLDEFVPRFAEAYRAVPTPLAAAAQVGAVAETKGESEGQAGKTRQPRPAGRKGGKESYDVVDLGISEEKRNEMRAFYKEKAPRNQNEQTAVVMDWLKREASKKTVSWDEIFTGFRTVEEKSPGKISSVLGNMVGLSWVKNAGPGQFELTHVGEDYVKFSLPATSKEKK